MSRQQEKGSKWRKRVEDFLADEGIPPRRQALHGVNDRGDVHVGPLDSPVVIECKDRNRHDLAGWLDEVKAEAGNVGSEVGIVAFHRRGKASPADGYWLVDGRTMAYLLREAGLA